MKLRETGKSDNAEIEKIHLMAFGPEQGPEIVELVQNLLADETARPLISLAAVEENGNLSGHILFTKAEIEQAGESIPVSAQLLAPLAVHPDHQGKGVGGLLIKEGLRMLKDAGVQLVFVLGHPDYYPRSGFRPAGELGLDAPYPIPEKDAGAWMVQELVPGVLGRAQGRLHCAEALDKPEYWRE